MLKSILTVVTFFYFSLTSLSLANAPVEGFADLADQLLPSVVNISTSQKIETNLGPGPGQMPDFPELPEGSPFKDFFEEFFHNGPHGGAPSAPAASLGSGFVIDAVQGYIVTNYHVIGMADEIRVTFHDDKVVDAKLIGHDEKTDIAVLKVNPAELTLTDTNFGDSDSMRVGDWVVAIGNPFGLGGTVTAGIVSARQRDINSGPYDDYLQTDASINRGNSGGPMFNMKGEVIGINTAIYSPSGGSVGIGFAIPSALAKPVVNQLIEYGRTRRGWLGVRIQSVTDEIAESLSLDKARGALVASLTIDGPAAKAGVKQGDVIISFNGRTIDTMRALPRLVAETAIEAQVPLTVWRNGDVVALNVTLGELEKAEETGLIDTGYNTQDTPIMPEEPAGQNVDELKLTVAPLTPALRERYSVADDTDGAIIIAVEANSEAEKKALIPGDVIVDVNQATVKNAANINAQIKAAKDAGRNKILLLVSRAGDIRFVPLSLDTAE